MISFFKRSSIFSNLAYTHQQSTLCPSLKCYKNNQIYLLIFHSYYCQNNLHTLSNQLWHRNTKFRLNFQPIIWRNTYYKIFCPRGKFQTSYFFSLQNGCCVYNGIMYYAKSIAWTRFKYYNTTIMLRYCVQSRTF